jgi:hypothetical protein
VIAVADSSVDQILAKYVRCDDGNPGSAIVYIYVDRTVRTNRIPGPTADPRTISGIVPALKLRLNLEQSPGQPGSPRTHIIALSRSSGVG